MDENSIESGEPGDDGVSFCNFHPEGVEVLVVHGGGGWEVVFEGGCEGLGIDGESIPALGVSYEAEGGGFVVVGDLSWASCILLILMPA